MRRIGLVLACVVGLAAPAAAQVSGPWARVVFGSATGPIITSGAGSPEGVVSAPIGSVYLQTDGAAGATLWTKTAAGTTGWATPAGAGGGGPHGLLSATHLDTTPATPLRGALVTGSSTPTWGRLPLGAAGTVLRSSGTDPAWSTDGSGLTTLNATNIASGTLDAARLPSTVSLFGAAVDTAELAAGAVTFAKWASNGCATGEIPKYDGAAWICGADDAVTGGPHSVLSATHLDTVPAALVAGDLLAANGSAALTRLPIGTAGQVLTVTAGAPAWAAATGGGGAPGGATGTLQTNAGAGAFGAYAGATCTAGQMVTAIAANGTVTCAAPAGGGGLVLLEQHTAAASASLDFTASISSTYDTYRIEFVNIVTATDNTQLLMRMSTDGGASYDSTASYSWTKLFIAAGGTGSGGNDSGGASEIQLAGNTGNTTNFSVNGWIELYHPGGTAYKAIVGQFTARVSSGDARRAQQVTSGLYEETVAVNAFRFLAGTGNITSGTIRVYGLAK